MTENTAFEPSGELVLGGTRLVRVEKGGLDVFLAPRHPDGHGRPCALCDRIGPGGETPYLPENDPDYVYYARALPDTRVVPLDVATCRARAAAGVPAWLDERRRQSERLDADVRDQVTRRRETQKQRKTETFSRLSRLFHRTKTERPLHSATDPLAAAARHCAGRAGIADLNVAPPPGSATERLRITAELNHMRICTCALVDGWWKGEFVPFLVADRDGESFWSVSLRYREVVLAWNGRTGETRAVDEAFAARVAPVCWQFVRPFPRGRVGWKGVAACFMRGNWPCVRNVIFHSFLISLLMCVTPIVTSLVFSEVVPNADRALLGQLILLSTLLAVSTCVVQFVHLQNIERFRTAGSLSLQLALFDRLLRLPVGFFRDYRPAELASRTTSCVFMLRQVGSATLKLVSNFVQMFVPLVMLFWYSIGLASAVIGVLIVYLALCVFFSWRHFHYSGIAYTRSGSLTGVVERYLRGAEKIRSAGAANAVFRNWADEFAETEEVYLAGARWTIAYEVLNMLLPGLLFCVTGGLIVWGYFAQVKGGTLSLSDFAGFTSTVSIVCGFLSWILYNISPILRGLPSFKWMSPIIEAEEDIANVKPGLTAETFQGGIELDHVSFAYPGGRQILNDVSIKADPGEFIALTGESGAGKSTALRLMLRFERPDSGAVRFDGKDIADCDMTALRRGFGVVMQTAATLPDTIFRNIVGYNGCYTEEEVWEAARMAGCEEAIKAFPRQLQTVLSEGSVSGGQRQRFLLAHAFIRRPRIFFLDEATSALDNATQKIVVDSLAQMKATRVVIAHRLSTIRDADRIYMLDHGRIAEVGTFDELMAMDGLFAKAARRQMLEKGENQ